MGDRGLVLATPDECSGVRVQLAQRHRTGVESPRGHAGGRTPTLDRAGTGTPSDPDAHFLPAFFLPATVFFGPLRVRAFVLVRWPRTGSPRRHRSPS